ncbi:MAG TPA: hypothetical protein VJH03_20355 [Blastocatellia bacterium]|nr:hypothetical protein [Blastocatellia bacterium]
MTTAQEPEDDGRIRDHADYTAKEIYGNVKVLDRASWGPRRRRVDNRRADVNHGEASWAIWIEADDRYGILRVGEGRASE